MRGDWLKKAGHYFLWAAFLLKGKKKNITFAFRFEETRLKIYENAKKLFKQSLIARVQHLPLSKLPFLFLLNTQGNPPTIFFRKTFNRCYLLNGVLLKPCGLTLGCVKNFLSVRLF